MTDGVGTTHLAVMMAVFLSMVRGEKVAIVEMNSKGCLRQAEHIRSNFDKNLSKNIKKRISIFSQSDITDIAQIVSSDYGYVVLDYGNEYDTYKQFFLLNNLKIIVGSLSWWKLQFYVAFLAKIEGQWDRRCFHYLATNVADKQWKYLKRHMGISVREIPYEPDPYRLSKVTLAFLDEFLK